MNQAENLPSPSSPKLPSKPLILLPTEAAQSAKWKRGRPKYDGQRQADEFVGDPIIECDEEFLDGLNYLQEAARQGWDTREWYEQLRDLREKIRAAYMEKHP